MSRNTRQHWLSSARSFLDRALAKRRPSRDQSPLRRSLRIEPLEDRSLLSITVNTLVDEADGSIVDGDISLRDAIAASPAGGVINFSVTGTINLALGEVVVQDRILEGPGAAQLTINANLLSRVFRTRRTTTISGMTITGGGDQFGGGIYHDPNFAASGHLTVRDCVITGNTAFKGGGIDCGGYPLSDTSVTVVNSTISGNTAIFGGNNTGLGGGIYNNPYSKLTVDKSTIAGNTAMGYAATNSGRGGGVWGDVTITNSTISGNRALFGSGIFETFGGGSTISNSTISGNVGRYGGLWLRNDSVVANSTITGSYIRLSGTPTLTNSIVASNIVGSVNAAASRNNLIGNPAAAGGLTNGVNGNIVGVIELGLGPLADNGGPTQTHALWSFSPAVNRGDNALIPIDPSTGLPFTTDQTGAPRIFNGGTVDMGAVEVQATVVPSTVVNTAADDVAANALTSLREAVGFARFLGGVVTFDPTVFATPQTIALVHGQVTVDGTSVPVTITGPGAGLATVDAGGASRIFDSYGTTTISGLKITGGSGNFDHRGAIKNNVGTLTIQDSEISGNANIGVWNADTLAISNSTIFGNSTPYSGGGIFNYELGQNPTATISNSNISGNSASDRGGGIYGTGPLTILNSTISGNSAAFSGGGIWNPDTLAIANSTIANNSASGSDGGGVWGNGIIINSTISGNSAGVFGGGVYNDHTMLISNSTISGNSAAFSGGGVFVDDDGDLSIVNSIIAGNDNGGSLPTDLEVGTNGTVTGSYNLIGDAATAGGLVNGVNGNIVGVDPLIVLGPLADNGGPTMTRAARGQSGHRRWRSGVHTRLIWHFSHLRPARLSVYSRHRRQRHGPATN